VGCYTFVDVALLLEYQLDRDPVCSAGHGPGVSGLLADAGYPQRFVSRLGRLSSIRLAFASERFLISALIVSIKVIGSGFWTWIVVSPQWVYELL
jgi:hypothetical protein